MSADPEHKKSKPWRVNLRKRRSGEASRSTGPALDFGHGASSRDPFLVVAIDFGTACSGYAYASSLKPDDIHLMRRVDSTPKDGGASHCKVPTALLLTELEDFVAFGYEAKELYSDMYPEEQQRYLFFEKFKMDLHYTENVHRNLLLTSANGKQVSAVTVFAHSLCYFKERFIQEIQDQSTTGVVDTAIRWVITVPAIWSPSAKQFVRLAAFEAGLIEEDSQDELLIALEPEAASIYCQKMKHSLGDLNDAMAKTSLTSTSPLKRNIGTGGIRRNKDSSSRLKLSSAESSPASSQSPGSSQSSESPIFPRRLDDTALFSTSMTYLVVDCGGGTVDLTVHKLVENGKLHELYKATGGAWGSVGVDHQFESLLWRIFGKESILGYQAHCPIGWIQLMDNFESKKRAASPMKAFAVNVLLPFSFMQYYFNKTQCTVESTVKAYHDPNIQWTTHGTLRLHPDTLVSLFHPVTDKIVGHIHTLLDHPRLAGISHLFLVGGFAESQVLQHEIRKAFEMRLRVVIPHDVSLSILKGAVFFGIDPTVVKIRRSALTYGVGVLNPFEPKLHPLHKQVIKGGKEWCTDIFEAYVHADQAVSLDDTVVKSYTPAVESQTSITITLFATDSPQAQFVTDPGVKRMGVLRLQMPATRWKEKMDSYREIKVCMRFGDTEIRVSAVDCKSGEVALATLDLLCK